MRELQRFRAAERWLIRRLRRMLDRADEFMHGWEVAVREDANLFRDDKTLNQSLPGTESIVREFRQDRRTPPMNDSPRGLRDQEYGVGGTSVRADSKKSLRGRAGRAKRRMTAAEFDAEMRRRVEARLAGEREMEYAR